MKAGSDLSKRPLITIGILPVVVLLLVSACAPAGASQGISILSRSPFSWFDAPLPDSIFALAPVQVVSHHTDPGCVDEIELSVNSIVVEASAPPNPCENLITFTQSWTPDSPGDFVLQVRSRNNSGVWSAYAETHISILDQAETQFGGIIEGAVHVYDVESTPGNPLAGVDVKLTGCGPELNQVTSEEGIFSFKGLPEGSCALEFVRTGWVFVSANDTIIQHPVGAASDPNLNTWVYVQMAPTNFTDVSPIEFSDRSLSTNTVYKGSCSPNQATFGVRTQHPDGIRSVTLFFRVRDAGGDTTAWSSGQTMIPQVDNYYALTLNANHMDNDSGFQQATVQYQFVIEPQDSAFSDFVRSDVFSDLTLLTCAQQPPSLPSPSPSPSYSPGPTPYPCEPYPTCLVH